MQVRQLPLREPIFFPLKLAHLAAACIVSRIQLLLSSSPVGVPMT